MNSIFDYQGKNYMKQVSFSVFNMHVPVFFRASLNALIFNIYRYSVLVLQLHVHVLKCKQNIKYLA